MPPDPRASDADRDELAAALGRHYVEGRLDADELSGRLEVVYGSGSLAEAAGALADLPNLAPPRSRARRRWLGHRHGEARRAQPGWLPTTERFRDPSTERVMRVWVDPADGSRHYVAETSG